MPRSARVIAPGGQPTGHTSPLTHRAPAGCGDAARGRAIFFDEKGVYCSRCHAVAGQGKSIGPELTTIGAQFSRAQLIESVLYPSKSIREGYQVLQLDTKDGDVLSGLFKGETTDEVLLLEASGGVNLGTTGQYAMRWIEFVDFALVDTSSLSFLKTAAS